VRQQRRGQGRRSEVEFRDVIVHRVRRVEHRQQWGVFLRLLRTTKRLPANRDLVRALSQLDEADFARRRNALHYGRHSWPGPDLRGPIRNETFGALTGIDDLLECLSDVDRADFGYVLGHCVGYLCVSMFADLARQASGLPALLPAASESLNRACGVGRTLMELAQADDDARNRLDLLARWRRSLHSINTPCTVSNEVRPILPRPRASSAE
jgi:hypothetical protein